MECVRAYRRTEDLAGCIGGSEEVRRLECKARRLAGGKGRIVSQHGVVSIAAPDVVHLFFTAGRQQRLQFQL